MEYLLARLVRLEWASTQEVFDEGCFARSMKKTVNSVIPFVECLKLVEVKATSESYHVAATLVVGRKSNYQRLDWSLVVCVNQKSVYFQLEFRVITGIT